MQSTVRQRYYSLQKSRKKKKKAMNLTLSFVPKRKESFDAEGNTADILDSFKSYRGMKGHFINLCIQLAHKQAFQQLRADLEAAEKRIGHVAEKKTKEGK